MLALVRENDSPPHVLRLAIWAVDDYQSIIPCSCQLRANKLSHARIVVEYDAH